MADAPTDTDQTPAPPPAPREDPPAAGGQSRPDLGKRAIAAVIDAVIAFGIGLVPFAGGIAATAYWLIRDGLDVDFMDHRSIGKKVMKLRPVTLDGQPMDIAVSRQAQLDVRPWRHRAVPSLYNYWYSACHAHFHDRLRDRDH